MLVKRYMILVKLKVHYKSIRNRSNAFCQILFLKVVCDCFLIIKQLSSYMLFISQDPILIFFKLLYSGEVPSYYIY